MSGDFIVGWCPVCDQGWVELVKEGVTGKLFFCCMECETEWNVSVQIKADNGTHDRFRQAIKPTIEEIKRADLKGILKKYLVV